ncbi:MAG: MBL fold metallo-hydrolase [Firmicutes bacterium]|nr:MBL fold metallo-hydrolase [Bacillota bacterium]MCL5014945.1 MBL fold metallo-hydrolase [Bacillota bacterium]
MSSEFLEPVAEGVWKTSVPSKTIPPYHHTHCYWIDTPKGFLLVDTGDGIHTHYLLAAYQELGRPIMLGVIMTHGHRDHVGGASFVCTEWHVPMWMDFKDRKLLDGGLMSLGCWRNIPEQAVGELPGIELIAAPGHTQGQINLFLRASRVLLAGDNLLGNSTSVITPPHGHLRTYLATLDRLYNLGAVLALPAHGDVITDPADYITQYRRHRFERLAQIRSALDSEALSAAEIAQMLYPGPQRMIGERMVMSHLQYLLEDREIRPVEGGERYMRLSS